MFDAYIYICVKNGFILHDGGYRGESLQPYTVFELIANNDNQPTLDVVYLKADASPMSHFIIMGEDSSRIKWNKNGPAALHLLELIKNQLIDPKNIKREYILDLKKQHPVFRPFSIDRFVANVRKLFREYNLEKTLQGKRKDHLRK